MTWSDANKKLTEPTDVAGLVVFRMALGLLVSIGALRFFANGWIDRFFVEPTFHFKYWGFSWVHAWPSWGMHLHVGAVALLGLFVAAGLFYRVSAALLFLSFTYLELIDVSVYLNHYYLLSLLLLLAACMPLGRAWSLDVWRDPSCKADSFPAWCTYVLRFQVATVYLFAGLAKLNSDWLLHAQPLNIWLSARTDLPVVGPWLDQWWVAMAMSWGGFLYDTTIWLWLSWGRTRPYAFVVVLLFHTSVGVLLNIGMFPFIMTSAALVFFTPSWPRRWLGEAKAPDAAHRTQWRLSRAALVLLGSFCLVQLALPLRRHLYDGNLHWTEQGMRWSWNVLVREKNGAVTFTVRLDDGRRRIVHPRRYLTAYQEREMSGQPDLILQLAHRIAEDWRKRAGVGVRVYADARVSLNGRRAIRMIDPTVDLARARDGLGPHGWILAGPPEPPIELRPLVSR